MDRSIWIHHFQIRSSSKLTTVGSCYTPPRVRQGSSRLSNNGVGHQGESFCGGDSATTISGVVRVVRAQLTSGMFCPCAVLGEAFFSRQLYTFIAFEAGTWSGMGLCGVQPRTRRIFGRNVGEVQRGPSTALIAKFRHVFQSTKTQGKQSQQAFPSIIAGREQLCILNFAFNFHFQRSY